MMNMKESTSFTLKIIIILNMGPDHDRNISGYLVYSTHLFSHLFQLIDGRPGELADPCFCSLVSNHNDIRQVSAVANLKEFVVMLAETCAGDEK